MKRALFILILSTIVQFSSFGQTQNGTSPLGLKIQFANPKIFHEGDTILIEIKLYNTTEYEQSVLIAKDKKFSFDFEMKTMQNRAVLHSEDYSISFNRPQPVFNSQVRIGTDEGYSYVLKLNDFFELNTPGQYFIRCGFFPQLKMNSSKENVLHSNYLTLNIRPRDIEQDFIREKQEIEQEKKLVITKRPPDEVLKFMLDARMKGEWEKFFLYLDLERLIKSNNQFNYKFDKADKERQIELIEEYKSYLKQNIRADISFLPHKYEVVRTEYSEGRGKVEVIVYFKEFDYVEKKYYTYLLNKKENIWYIYNYEVMNLVNK